MSYNFSDLLKRKYGSREYKVFLKGFKTVIHQPEISLVKLNHLDEGTVLDYYYIEVYP